MATRISLYQSFRTNNHGALHTEIYKVTEQSAIRSRKFMIKNTIMSQAPKLQENFQRQTSSNIGIIKRIA